MYNCVMTRQSSALLKKALALPAEEREALAVSLMDSLNHAMDPNVEAAWDREIARRIEELDSGKVKAIPWETVRRGMAAKLCKRR